MRKINLVVRVPDNIAKACELAREPGGCKYIDEDGYPCCVIGQLYALEGFDTNDLKDVNKFSSYIESENMFLLSDKYGKERLDNLQNYWDDSNERTNDQLLEKAAKLWG